MALRHVPDGRGRRVATDVSRHPSADRPTAGATPHEHEGGGGQMRQTMTTEVRLDEGKTKNCSAMRPATDCLGRSQHPSREHVASMAYRAPPHIYARTTS